mgnify:FL=1
MYADDLVEWLMTLAANANSQCPIYNVASDDEIEIRELANIVSDIFNVNVSCSGSSFEEVDRYIPSTQKAQKILGLRINYDLYQSILLSF